MKNRLIILFLLLSTNVFPANFSKNISCAIKTWKENWDNHPINKAKVKRGFIKSITKDSVLYPPSVSPDLISEYRKITHFLELHMINLESRNIADSLKMLRDPDFKIETGIDVLVGGPIQVTLKEIETYRKLRLAGKKRKLYNLWYMKEIEALLEQPRFDAINGVINIPGKIQIIVKKGADPLSLAEAQKQGLITQESMDFYINMEMLTIAEELFHATDYLSHSAYGGSQSKTMNQFLRYIDEDFSYSDMTETAFAFFALHDHKVSFFENNPKLKALFIKYYDGRKVLNNPRLPEIFDLSDIRK